MKQYKIWTMQIYTNLHTSKSELSSFERQLNFSRVKTTSYLLSLLLSLCFSNISSKWFFKIFFPSLLFIYLWITNFINLGHRKEVKFFRFTLFNFQKLLFFFYHLNFYKIPWFFTFFPPILCFYDINTVHKSIFSSTALFFYSHYRSASLGHYYSLHAYVDGTFVFITLWCSSISKNKNNYNNNIKLNNYIFKILEMYILYKKNKQVNSACFVIILEFFQRLLNAKKPFWL